jgi:hypothetical protein
MKEKSKKNHKKRISAFMIKNIALEVSFELNQQRIDPTSNIATFIKIATINGVSDIPRFQNQGVSSKSPLQEYACDPEANRRADSKTPAAEPNQLVLLSCIFCELW